MFAWASELLKVSQVLHRDLPADVQSRASSAPAVWAADTRTGLRFFVRGCIVGSSRYRRVALVNKMRSLLVALAITAAMPCSALTWKSCGAFSFLRVVCHVMTFPRSRRVGLYEAEECLAFP